MFIMFMFCSGFVEFPNLLQLAELFQEQEML